MGSVDSTRTPSQGLTRETINLQRQLSKLSSTTAQVLGTTSRLTVLLLAHLARTYGAFPLARHRRLTLAPPPETIPHLTWLHQSRPLLNSPPPLVFYLLVRMGEQQDCRRMKPFLLSGLVRARLLVRRRLWLTQSLPQPQARPRPLRARPRLPRAILKPPRTRQSPRLARPRLP